MKFPSIQNIPSELISDPSQTDLKYMDDDDNYPSQQNLQLYAVNTARDTQVFKEKTSGKSQNISPKPSKRKPLAKQHKTPNSPYGVQMKRTTSQTRTSNLNYTKLYSKKSSEFRQLKFSQFQLICKTFNIFSSHHITFNDLVLALKSLGVQIQSEKKFQTLKNIHDEFVGKNDLGIDFQMFGKIAIRLLKDQRNKQNSDLMHVQKGFYYMIQQANNISWPFSKQEQASYSQKQLFSEFKSHVDHLPQQQRYLNKDSLAHLAKYLGMEKQLNQKDIETMIKFGEKQDKGYLALEDVMRCIHGNKVVDL